MKDGRGGITSQVMDGMYLSARKGKGSLPWGMPVIPRRLWVLILPQPDLLRLRFLIPELVGALVIGRLFMDVFPELPGHALRDPHMAHVVNG
jgi:hypothetical protein